MEESDSFLVDGYERLRSEHEPKIRAEVERKFAEQIASSSWLNRRRIRKHIEREIATKLGYRSSGCYTKYDSRMKANRGYGVHPQSS